MRSRGALAGEAQRLRVDVEIAQAEGGTPVARGYTVHAITDPGGKPIRPPAWLAQLFDGVKHNQPPLKGQASS
jgi:acyl-CoA thioesterase FadM